MKKLIALAVSAAFAAPALSQDKPKPPPAWHQGKPAAMAESKLAPHAGKILLPRGSGRPSGNLVILGLQIGGVETLARQDILGQERFHHRQDAFVPDAFPHPIHEGRMRDFVETGRDVALHDPLIRVGGKMAYLGHRVMGPAIRAESIRTG